MISASNGLVFGWSSGRTAVHAVRVGLAAGEQARVEHEPQLPAARARGLERAHILRMALVRSQGIADVEAGCEAARLCRERLVDVAPLRLAMALRSASRAGPACCCFWISSPRRRGKAPLSRRPSKYASLYSVSPDRRGNNRGVRGLRFVNFRQYARHQPDTAASRRGSCPPLEPDK